MARCSLIYFVTSLLMASAECLPVKPVAGLDLPFRTRGPNIITNSGDSIKLAGTNWPGHGPVMVPEGLQYQSVKTIVSDAKSLGMNVNRLTFAIQMIDEIYNNGGEDVDLQTAFSQGLGDKGAAVLDKVLANNPQFTAQTTRLEVFDAIVEECARQKIYINLDNHVSRADWCCGLEDGNTWWGDASFDADNWSRGLAYMAKHGKSWGNLASMSLRNELRQPSNNDAVAATYNWKTWYSHVLEGAAAINSANPDVLIILSGLDYAHDIQAVVRGAKLTPGNRSFSFDDFPGYGNKLILEMHNYQNGISSCDKLQSNIYNGGAQAMNPNDSRTVNVFPVIISEFGFPQDGSTYKGIYASCLAEWIPKNTAGWMNWAFVGSYYTREGIADYDDTWGVYKHDWSGWRDKAYMNNQLIPMVRATVN